MENSSLDRFCDSPFWDTNLTWNTDFPLLTPCFEKTVLVWVPCLFLWAFLPFDIYFIYISKNRNIPWNWRNILKLVISVLMLLICCIEFVYTLVKLFGDTGVVQQVDIYTPIIKVAAIATYIGLMLCHRKKGIRSSGLVFIFWFLLVIMGIGQFTTVIRLNLSQNKADLYSYTYIIYFLLGIIVLLLNFIADLAPQDTKFPRVDNPCPESAASFPSRLTFSWFDSMAFLGFKKPLVSSDLWNMNYEDMASEIIPIFDRHWNNTVRKNNATTMAMNGIAKPVMYKSTGSVDLVGVENKLGNVKQKPSSILPALCYSFGPTFLSGAVLKLINDLLAFISPQILRLLIEFVSGDEPHWRGYLYASILLIVATIQTLTLAQYFNNMMLVGLRIRTVLISAIYRKALKLSNSARKESTVGEIVNLMSVDAQRFMDLTTYINMIWSAPLQIALALYFLWQILGPSVMAGLAVMIVLIPVNGYIANQIKKLQIKQMKNKDERVKMMNEILSGIKVLKLYAWEPSFEQQVLRIREKEVKVLKQAAYFNALTSFIWTCAPFLVSAMTFTVYVLVDENNVLDAQTAFVALALFNVMRMPLSLLPLIIVACVEVALVSFAVFVLSSEENILDAKTAFVSLSLFNLLRFPLSMLPMMITSVIQTSVSVKRINKFMNSDELDPHAVSHEENEAETLVMENCTFKWDSEDETPVLRNISLRIQPGALVGIVGAVGAGKSSLLAAFLGELEKLSGRVNTRGTVAYVPQVAWIQNCTLQDNILFGKPLDNKQYQKIVEACALKPDLEMLPGGDQTEIGEKGINLSGGQKQRVSLARAVYYNSDVYFLDDPLSAVDSHVGKHIFENVIGPKGILRRKTRLLVTHSITYLPEVDLIVVLKDGEISEMGTYKELLDKKGAFSEFLTSHLQEVDNAELEDLDDQLKKQLIDNNPELQQQMHRQRSVSSDASSMSSLTRRRSSGSSHGPDEFKPSGGMEKLIEEEKAEIGGVKWEVYAHYLRSIGAFLTVTTIILNVIFQGFAIGSNLWLSVWSSDNTTMVNGTQDTHKRDLYLEVYGVLGLGQMLSTVLGTLTLSVGCVKAGLVLHNFLLRHTLHAPMQFFDTTPVGRIVNRFSKDVDVMDNVLLFILRALIVCLFTTSDDERTPEPVDGHKMKQPITGNVSDAFQLFTYLGTIKDFLKKCNIVNALRFLHLVCFSAGVLFIVHYCIAVYLSDVVPLIGSLAAAFKFHNFLLAGIMRAPLSFTDTTPLGRILARFSKDTDVVDNVLPRGFSDIFYYIFEVVATLVVISYTTPIFIAVIIPIGIIYYFIQRYYVATSRQLKRLESVTRSPIYSHFGESVTGSMTIRAYNVQTRFVKESEQKVDYNQVCTYPGIIANRWLAVRLEMVGNLIIFFSALFSVIGRDSMNAGLVGLSVSYALQITQTLNWLVRMTAEVETNIVAVERIKEYGETPQEAPWEITPNVAKDDWPTKGNVEFKKLEIRYREGLELVLKGISFDINGGEKVGIVGRTGAGKSSLTLGLFRIVEAAGGSILIDGIDISKLGLHALRSRITIIPQDPVLFSGTLRINLDPFEKYTDDQIWRSLELAHLKAYVKGLPAGLQHQVSEGGDNLSVGQRQLVCLARALLRKTKVLVLDEATAAVDLETDDLIQSTIRTEFADCTVLTIAHRINTILDSDRVLVLDKGEIVEFNSPDALLKDRTSLFYSMAKDAGLV